MSAATTVHDPFTIRLPINPFFLFETRLGRGNAFTHIPRAGYPGLYWARSSVDPHYQLKPLP